jgi:hypothetical protein
VTVAQKTAVSLLVSVILIAGFTVAAFAGLFAVVETRFYQPAVVRDIQQRVGAVSSGLDEYLYIHISRFSALASSRAIQNSFDTNLSDEDIRHREDFSGTILMETAGLRGIRLVDSNGRRVHFSTFKSDFLRQTQHEITYSNYSALNEIDYGLVRAVETDENQIFFDKENNRLVFSFPVFDRWKAYRGSLLFYLDADDFGRYLALRGTVNMTDYPVLVAAAGQGGGAAVPQSAGARGFVFGVSGPVRDALIAGIESHWQSAAGADEGVSRLAAVQDTVWVVLSNSKSRFGIVSWVYPEDFFLLPFSARIVLLFSFFITVYLIIFLILNAQKDPLVLVRDKIRRFQISFLQSYFETKEEIDWNGIAGEIASRKYEVSAEIKRSVGRQAAKHKDAIDALLEKNWEDILAVIGKKPDTRQPAAGQTSTDELRAMLEQVLSRAQFPALALEAPAAAPVFADSAAMRALPDGANTADDIIEEAEEIDELDEALADFEDVLVPAPEPAGGSRDGGETPEPEKAEELGEIPAELEGEPAILEGKPAAAPEDAGESPDNDDFGELEELEAADTMEELNELPAYFSNGLAAATIDGAEARDGTFREEEKIEEELRIEFPNEAAGDTEDIDIDFEVYLPDFSLLDSVEGLDGGASEDQDTVHYMIEAQSGDTPICGLFTQTAFFGAPQELQSANADVIIERNGIYKIPEDAVVFGVEQDSEFKTLVDSLLAQEDGSSTA